MHKLKLIWGLLKVFLPEPLVRLIYTGRLTTVAGRTIDPKAMAASDLVTLLRDPDKPPSLQESRAQIATLAAKFERPCPASVTKTDLTLPGASGPRPARIYTIAGRDPRAAQPTLLYLHGGGWVQGNIDTHDGLCGALADLSGVRVISFDYRLAPEHPFPAAPDDVLACYRALLDNADDLNVTPDHLAIGGDSAGGNLAAVLLHDIAENALPMPVAQLLIYPGTDGRLSSQSMRDLAGQPLLAADRIDWYLSLYLPPDQDRTAPRVSPLFSPHHADMPPALIIAGGHDPLWDDALSLAKSLKAANVPVELLTYPGQIHAFLSLTKVIPQGRDAIAKSATWLKATLA